MVGAALGIWIVTALMGAYLWSFTTEAGRPESSARASDLPAPLLFVHPLIGLAGLAVWIYYTVRGGDVLPWVALGGLLLGLSLGAVMAARTFRGRERRGGRPATARAEGRPHVEPADVRYVEDRIPLLAIVVHGLLAGLTTLLVFLVAIGVGD